MIEAFTVGAVFTVEDRATAVLAELAEQAALTDEAIVRLGETLLALRDINLSPLMAEMERVGVAATDLGTLFIDVREEAAGLVTELATAAAPLAEAGTAATALGVELIDVTAEAAALTAELGRAAAAGASITVAGAEGAAVGAAGGGGGAAGEEAVAGGAAGRGGGGGGGHGSVLKTAGELAAIFALYEGGKAAFTEEQNLARAVLALGVDPSSEEGKAMAARMREEAAAASKGTSFSEATAAAGLPVLLRPLQERGQKGLDDSMGVYREVFRAAEGAQLEDERNRPEDTIAGTVAFMHESRIYDPKEASHMMDVLNAITMNVPHATYGAEASSMSYFVPFARTAGIDPEEAATMVGFLQQAGLQGTVGATTARQMITGLLRTGQSQINSPHRHHLESTSRVFEHDLHLTPDAEKALGHDAAHAPSEHVEALKKVGYYDDNMKPQFLDSKGGIDLQKVVDIFTTYASSHDQFDTAQEFYQLFGVRGQQAPGLIAGSAERYGTFAEQTRQYSTLQHIRDEMGMTTAQQAGQAGARGEDVLNDLITQQFPRLREALKPLIADLESLQQFNKDHPDAANYEGVGVLGAMGLATLGGYGIVRRLFGGGGRGGGGGAGAGGAAGAEATGGFLGMGLSFSELIGLLFLSGDTDDSPENKEAQRLQKLDDANRSYVPRGMPSPSHMGSVHERHQEERRIHDLDLANSGYVPRHAQDTTGGIPGQLDRAEAARQVEQRTENTTITVGPITLNGVGSDIGGMVHELMEKLAHGIATSLSHDSGSGAGTYSSPPIATGVPP